MVSDFASEARLAPPHFLNRRACAFCSDIQGVLLLTCGVEAQLAGCTSPLIYTRRFWMLRSWCGASVSHVLRASHYRQPVVLHIVVTSFEQQFSRTIPRCATICCCKIEGNLSNTSRTLLQAMGMGRDGGAEMAEDGRGGGLGGGADGGDEVITLSYEEVNFSRSGPGCLILRIVKSINLSHHSCQVAALWRRTDSLGTEVVVVKLLLECAQSAAVSSTRICRRRGQFLSLCRRQTNVWRSIRPLKGHRTFDSSR